MRISQNTQLSYQNVSKTLLFDLDVKNFPQETKKFFLMKPLKAEFSKQADNGCQQAILSLQKNKILLLQMDPYTIRL